MGSAACKAGCDDSALGDDAQGSDVRPAGDEPVSWSAAQGDSGEKPISEVVPKDEAAKEAALAEQKLAVTVPAPNVDVEAVDEEEPDPTSPKLVRNQAEVVQRRRRSMTWTPGYGRFVPPVEEPEDELKPVSRWCVKHRTTIIGDVTADSLHETNMELKAAKEPKTMKELKSPKDEVAEATSPKVSKSKELNTARTGKSKAQTRGAKASDAEMKEAKPKSKSTSKKEPVKDRVDAKQFKNEPPASVEASSAKFQESENSGRNTVHTLRVRQSTGVRPRRRSLPSTLGAKAAGIDGDKERPSHEAQLDQEKLQTKFHAYILQGNLVKVRLLVQAKADINEKHPESKRTALSVACAEGHQRIAGYLISEGADLNSHADVKGFTPLHCCVHKASKGVDMTESVRKLVQAKADLTIMDKIGRTAADLAAELSRHEILDLIGASVPSSPGLSPQVTPFSAQTPGLKREPS